MFTVELFENGKSIGVEFASTRFEADHIKIVHTATDPEGSTAVIEDITHFNEDWLDWPDAPGGDSYADGCDPGCAVHKCSAYECPCASERMDAWAAQIKYENAHLEFDPQVGDLFRYQDNCAEASWYAFCAH